MRSLTMTAVLTTVTLAGCNDGDDLDGSAQIAELDDEDSESLCHEFADRLGGPGKTFTCEGTGAEFSAPTQEECADSSLNPPPESCEITVDELLDCASELGGALADDPCSDEVPAACEEFFATCVTVMPTGARAWPAATRADT